MLLDLENYWVELPHMLTGANAANQVGEIVQRRGGNKALIVTDEGIMKAGLSEKICQSLEKSKLEYIIFDKCKSDAPMDSILSCSQYAKEGHFDAIIGLGGGSAMDIAKLTARLSCEDNINSDTFHKYLESGPGLNKLHNIMISTTAGTGAEVSPNVVVTDNDGLKKFAPGYTADVAIIDPMMTLNLPPMITAETGIDALSHTVECYLHPKSNIFSDTIREMIIKTISDNLREAYYNGPNRLDVRLDMAVAAAWSITAGSFSPNFIMCHLLAHALQDVVHTTHGVSVALVLPPVMEFGIMTNLPKYARLAELMGENIKGLSEEAAAMKSVVAMKSLIQDLGLPQKLSDIGLQKEQIPQIIDILFLFYEEGMNTNPRPASREDVAGIFESAL